MISHGWRSANRRGQGNLPPEPGQGPAGTDRGQHLLLVAEQCSIYACLGRSKHGQAFQWSRHRPPGGGKRSRSSTGGAAPPCPSGGGGGVPMVASMSRPAIRHLPGGPARETGGVISISCQSANGLRAGPRDPSRMAEAPAQVQGARNVGPIGVSPAREPGAPGQDLRLSLMLVAPERVATAIDPARHTWSTSGDVPAFEAPRPRRRSSPHGQRPCARDRDGRARSVTPVAPSVTSGHGPAPLACWRKAL